MRREEREGEEGEEDEKRTQRGDSAPRSSLFFVPVVMPLPYCRFSSFANWLSMWFVLSAPALFSPISIRRPPFLPLFLVPPTALSQASPSRGGN